MTALSNDASPSSTASAPLQVMIVHDLEVGDYLPDYGQTVHDMQIRTERLGIEWVDLALANGRTVTLDGLDDIAVHTFAKPGAPRRRGEAQATTFERS